MLRATAASTSIARHSARIEVHESSRILDDASRIRRIKKQLAALEQDNSHEDPHANLVWHKAIPKFDDNDVPIQPSASKPKKSERKRLTADQEELLRRKRKFRSEHAKQRFRKNFAMLVEEENQRNKDDPLLYMAYSKATAPPSRIPSRHFCAPCGFISKYTCIKCGARYCTLRCRDAHNDTRCLKYTA